MEDTTIDLVEQIERCRRLARSMTDDDLRDALRDLAEHYEAQLERQRRRRGDGFMLRHR